MAKGRVRIRRGATTGELEETLKSVQERYGEKSVRRGDEVFQPDRVSTGSFIMDFATLGGIPLNRASMIVGERHSGKSTIANKIIASVQRQYPEQTPVLLDIEGCVAGDSEILDSTTGRVFTAKQIYDNSIPVTVLSRTDDDSLVPMPITARFDNGLKEVYEVFTVNTSLKTTRNHRFLVYSGDGAHEWIRCDELQEGMLVCRPRRVSSLLSRPPISSVTPEESRLLGYLLGDGSFGKSNSSPVFTNIDADIIRDVRSISSSMGVSLVQFSDRHYRMSYSSYRGGTREYNSNPVMALLDRVGLRGLSGADKFLPREIMTGPHSVVRGALTGLYATDGCVNSCRPSLSFTNISRELVSQIRHLWAEYGVVARMQRYDDGVPEHSVWYTLTINGRRSLRVAEEVLTMVGGKGEALRQWCNGKDERRSPVIGEYYPERSLLNSRERMDKTSLLNSTDLYWERVEKVEYVGVENTYDFTVEGTHNLVINDVVVHNTFDATWAKALGVDLERLQVVECDSGEMAVDVGAAVIQSLETSLVVVDSIAALSPMKEQEDSAEDANVALQARLVAKFVRKVTSGMIKERQRNHLVTLLHLNQFRTKIGGYGDPRTLPGGRALEYSTSFQVIIKNKENKGRDVHGVETMTHNEHPYTITKNKMNNGPRTGEFTLIREAQEENHLAIGDIDDSSTVLSYAKKFGLYHGGGTSWKLEFEDTNKKFGKAAQAIDALREDYDLYWALRTHLIRLQAVKYNMPRQFIERIV